MEKSVYQRLIVLGGKIDVPWPKYKPDNKSTHWQDTIDIEITPYEPIEYRTSDLVDRYVSDYDANLVSDFMDANDPTWIDRPLPPFRAEVKRVFCLDSDRK